MIMVYFYKKIQQHSCVTNPLSADRGQEREVGESAVEGNRVSCTRAIYCSVQLGQQRRLIREKVRGATVHKVGSKIPTRLTNDYISSL
jgi:hypothetical protein